MLSFKELYKEKEGFSQLVGMTVEEFQEIVKQASPRWTKFLKSKKILGRKARIETLEDELILAFLYYRFDISYKLLGYMFNMNEASVFRHIKKAESMLNGITTLNKDRTLSLRDFEKAVFKATGSMI